MPFSETLPPETLGLAVATTAAIFWAVSSLIWGVAGVKFKPIVLNCYKGLAAVVLFAITMLVMGESVVEPLTKVAPWKLIVLGASGIVGIAAGDTCYFASLNRIGPRQASLLYLLSSPMVAGLGWVFLGEALSLWSILGILLAVGGVAWVVTEEKQPPRPGRDVKEGMVGSAVTKQQVLIGVLFGVLAATGQSVGAVMNRGIVGDVDPDKASEIWTAMWRLVIGTSVLLPAVIVISRRPKPASKKPTGKFWLLLATAIFLGTYCGIWMQQAAFTWARAGMAQTMLSTTPIWILPMAALAGERITLKAVLGSLVAFGGVVLLFSQSGNG